MARGLRSSRNKTNNSKLRSTVFGPAEAARKERLSSKLLELASKPQSKEGKDAQMITGDNEPNKSKFNGPELDAVLIPTEEDMDIDPTTGINSATKPTARNLKRVQKNGRGSARAAMVFPIYKKGRRVGPRLNARQKKKSLRP